jgi:hypothetical protein
MVKVKDLLHSAQVRVLSVRAIDASLVDCNYALVFLMLSFGTRPLDTYAGSLFPGNMVSGYEEAARLRLTNKPGFAYGL